MTSRRLLAFPLMASLAMPPSLLAQRPPVVPVVQAMPPLAQATQPADATEPASRPTPQPQTLRLTVSPAAEPTPPLRYRLTYPMIEQTPGDALAVLLNALLLLPDDSAAAAQATDREDPSDLLDLEPIDVPRAQRTLAYYRTAMNVAEKSARRSQYAYDSTIREEGVQALLPSLSPQRQLATALALRMRVEIAEGRVADAVATARVIYTHAARLGEGQTLVEMLVGVGIASLANRRLQELLQRPDSPNLYWSLAEIRPITTGHDAITGEQAWLGFSFQGVDLSRRDQWTIDDWTRITDQMPGLLGMVQTHQPDDNQQRLEVALATAASLPWARGYLKSIGVGDDELAQLPPRVLVGRAWFEHYDRTLQDLVKWWSLPYPQAHAGMQAFEQRLQADRVRMPFNFAALLLPSLSRARWTVARLDRELAAMQAVEAIRAHVAATGSLPATLADVAAMPVPPDPSTGQPFGYEPAGRSFVLTSPHPAGLGINDGLRVEVTVR